jgi:hypothetical protein
MAGSSSGGTPPAGNWTAYLIKVTTGQIGPMIDVESGSWSMTLNDIEQIKVRVRKNSLPRNLDTSTWLDPWWGGVLLCWNGIPIVAGPIIDRPMEDFTYIDLNCAGIRAVLAKRTAIPELADMSKLNQTTLTYNGMSLGTIAKYCVKNAQSKPGGSLPIAFPMADQTGPNDDVHTRTYQGYDLANIFCNDVLTKLSGVHLGPDIMFKPRKLDDSRLVWDMWTGSEGMPRIAQNSTLIWDATVQKGPIVDLQIVNSGAYETDRVYSLGSGQDQGTVITISEDQSKITTGHAFLETAINTSNSSDPAVVKSHGDADLEQNFNDIIDVELTVRADSEVYPLGTYWAGDFMELFTQGWYNIGDGRHGMRLITISGDLTNNVKLALQREFDFENAQS